MAEVMTIHLLHRKKSLEHKRSIGNIRKKKQIIIPEVSNSKNIVNLIYFDGTALRGGRTRICANQN